MEISSKPLPDGRAEVTIILSKEELKKIAETENNFSGIFDTTRYCVTCTLNDQKHDIDVYGDVGANIKATALCGPGLYRLHVGSCD